MAAPKRATTRPAHPVRGVIVGGAVALGLFIMLAIVLQFTSATSLVEAITGWDLGDIEGSDWSIPGILDQLTGSPETLAAAATVRKRRRARAKWLADLGVKRVEAKVGVATWKSLRDQSWLDEIATVLLVGLVVGAVTAYGTSGGVRADAALIAAVSAALLALLALALFATPQGRAYATRLKVRAMEARYIETAVVREFDTVWAKAAGFPDGKAPELVPGSVWLSGHWIDPGPEGPLSALPVGLVPTEFGFKVKPAAIETPDPDKQAQLAQAIAERYRSAASYGSAQGAGDPAMEVTVALDYAATMAAPTAPAPVTPDRFADRWPSLMAELDLTDKRGNIPELTAWEYAAPDRVETAAPASTAVLDALPPMIQGAFMPTALQVTDSDHTKVVDRLAQRLGYISADAYPFAPDVGVGFIMWRDGRPALLPATYTDLVDNFDGAMAEVFDGAAVPTPRLVSQIEGPVTPENGPETWLAQADSILTGDRPEYFTWQLGLADPNDAAATVRILTHRLAMHKVEHVQHPTLGLLVRAIRSPLPLGQLVDLDQLGTDHDGAMVVGKVPGGPLLLPYRDRPHSAVVGETGSGKGEFLALQGVGGLLRDWVWFFLDPKPNSDMAALMSAAIDVRAPAQRAACLELATMEIKLRAWKFDAVTSRVNVVDELLEGGRLSVRDFRHYAELSAQNVAAGGDPFPPIGPPLLLQHDESAEDLLVSDEMRAHVSSIARLARFVGFMLTLATQNPTYDALGGGQVVSNIGNHFILRTNKAEMLNPLGGPTKPDAITLMTGQGKGHNFHTTVRDISDPFTALRTFTEGQLDWVGQSVNWIAAQVVGPYLQRNPDVVTEGRDFIADLKAARELFTGSIERADFSQIDHGRFPYILGPAPLTGPRGLVNLPTRTAAEDAALDGRQDVAEVIRLLPPHPDQEGR